MRARIARSHWPTLWSGCPKKRSLPCARHCGPMDGRPRRERRPRAHGLCGGHRLRRPAGDATQQLAPPSPRACRILWRAPAVSFAMSVALAAYQLASPTRTPSRGTGGILHSCGVVLSMGTGDPNTADLMAIALPVAVLLALLLSFAFHVARGRRARSRHRNVLDMVGRHCGQLHATVIEHASPAAYCLPGRRSPIVVARAPYSCFPRTSSMPYWSMSGPTLSAVTTRCSLPRRHSPPSSEGCRWPGMRRSRRRSCWR
ncbi:hypothetical protein SMICM17S_10638 [Streptomyces microflavus]